MVCRHRWPLGGALLGLLILTLLTVTARRMTERAAAPPVMAAAHTIGVVRDDGGLQLSLSVPRGPYFRDELLPVTLVLANNSGRPIPFSGTYLLGSCRPSPLDVTMASGGQYLDPVAIIGIAPSCPGFPRGPYPVLAAGKALRVRILLGLSAGGRLTLTGRAFFAPNARVVSPGLPAPGGRWDVLRRIVPGLFRSSYAPFASGWPSLTLWLRSVAPVSRMLHLVRRGHVVYVQRPGHTLPPLVAEQAAEDTRAAGSVRDRDDGLDTAARHCPPGPPGGGLSG